MNTGVFIYGFSGRSLPRDDELSSNDTAVKSRVRAPLFIDFSRPVGADKTPRVISRIQPERARFSFSFFLSFFFFSFDIGVMKVSDRLARCNDLIHFFFSGKFRGHLFQPRGEALRFEIL